ncbi:DUF4382 domain-containing protein [Halomarina salina]|uniref:DUF4382 domain-containing protein n=1 Tax=Halomarina salina TaxID=1872699 RepID=A0ABD5RLI0_9EURY|nr:DUF4382 domain-containing protein [Halomarina salina]
MKRAAAAVLVVSMLVLAGCSATLPGTNAEETGTVQLYVSDERNAIDQFSRLDVTVTGVAFRTAEQSPEAATTATNVTGSGLPTDATDATDDWERHAVENVTVDLTRLQGENATRLGNLTVASGDYGAVRLDVAAAEGTLQDGERVDVTLPSDRLRLDDRFTVESGSEVEFVFDVTVVDAGDSGRFVLKPVASESGTDRTVRLVDATVDTPLAAGANVGDQSGTGARTSEDLELHVDGMPAPGQTVTVRATRDDAPVTGARVLVDGESVGTTDADGALDVTLPSSGETTLRVEHGSASVDAHLVFG